MIFNHTEPPRSPSSSAKWRVAPSASVENGDTVVETTSPKGSSTEVPAVTPLPGSYDRWKRAVDLALGVPLAILLLPVILMTAVLVKFTSKGTAFYTQTRVGRFGHCFRIYKIRTMRHDAEAHTGAKWAAKNDSRTTWLGKILRKTHFDELPQILNVLKGDMSLVGPRPERPEFTAMLEAAIPHYRNRMLIRPGVTGLAQVFLPPDTDVNSVRRKLTFDLRYLDRMSLWLDLRLMAATFLQSAGLPCGVTQFVLWLPSMRDIESPPPVTRHVAVPAANG